MIHHQVEQTLRRQGIEIIAGIDEAGRGPLAGPVVAAAVIFRDGSHIEGVDDSKKLSPAKREKLFDAIKGEALSIGVGILPPSSIDEMNIYRATMEAMAQAIRQLSPQPHHLLIDGPRYHEKAIPFTAIIGGDAKCFSIAAASIIAKVTRDRIMQELDKEYPEYGFARHKGYGTAAHLAALRKFGPSPVHRKSFRMPTREVLSHD